MQEIGDQIKFLILQYMDTPRIIQYVGVDGISPQTFDYDPTSMIPSHLPGDNPGTALTPRESLVAKNRRGRIVAGNMRYFITPNSLHELTQMAFKLGLIQLKKAGVQIDSQTLAETWNVPNYGTIPGNTVRDKFKAEQQEGLIFAMKMAQLQQAMQAAAQEGGPDLGAMVDQVMNPSQEGRPPTGQEAPALKQKPNGRATVTESEGGGHKV